MSDQIAIASKFLLSSPPGEETNVFTDILGLWEGNKAELRRELSQTMGEYLQQQLIPVENPTDQSQVLLSRYNLLASGKFVDPRGHSFKVDPFSQKTTDWEPLDELVTHPKEKLRVALQDKVNKYVQDFYRTGLSAAYFDYAKVITTQQVQLSSTGDASKVAAAAATDVEDITEKQEDAEEGTEKQEDAEEGTEKQDDAEEGTEKQDDAEEGTEKQEQVAEEATEKQEKEDASVEAGKGDEEGEEEGIGKEEEEKEAPPPEVVTEMRTVLLDSDEIIILIVANKYNPENYWNGRWRSEWTFNAKTGELNGVCKVHVHYYEEGNVALNSETKFSISTTPPNDGESEERTAERVVQQVKKNETEWHTRVNNSYQKLSESAFRELRRPLPVFRTKIDWDKISHYKVGSDLANKQQ